MYCFSAGLAFCFLTVNTTLERFIILERKYKWLLPSWYSVTAAIDITITLSMCHLLRKDRDRLRKRWAELSFPLLFLIFVRTLRMLDRMVLWTIGKFLRSLVNDIRSRWTETGTVTRFFSFHLESAAWFKTSHPSLMAIAIVATVGPLPKTLDTIIFICDIQVRYRPECRCMDSLIYNHYNLWVLKAKGFEVWPMKMFSISVDIDRLVRVSRGFGNLRPIYLFLPRLNGRSLLRTMRGDGIDMFTTITAERSPAHGTDISLGPRGVSVSFVTKHSPWHLFQESIELSSSKSKV